jgi:hypothetical protein
MQKNTRFPVILAMSFGLGAPLIPGFLSLGLWTSVLYFVGAGILGLIWQYKSWQWGLWMTVPILVLALLSVMFVGGFDVFLKNDFPRLLMILVAACAGGVIFPLVRNLFIKKPTR